MIAHSADGEFDVAALLAMARGWPGLEGMDLAKDVSTETHYGWEGGVWRLGFGYEERCPAALDEREGSDDALPRPLPRARARDARTSSRSIMAPSTTSSATSCRPARRCRWCPRPRRSTRSWRCEPDGIFLSNGPGDPAATGEYAVPVIRQLLETRQAAVRHLPRPPAARRWRWARRTTKMFQGHRGANHPVKRLSDGAVEITSMNHGFAVERDSLPASVRETHVSLFDGIERRAAS